MITELVIISASEKEAVSKKFPRVHIVRTMKNRSGRHRYYMTEDAAAMRLLRTMRGQERAFEKRKGV